MKVPSAQLLQDAEALKASLTEAPPLSRESRLKQQKLGQLFEELLLYDLEYALDKKVEQELWNYVFRNPISALQSKAKTQKKINSSETVAQLTLLLESASGFYFQLLQKICCAFDVDLLCFSKDLTFESNKKLKCKFESSSIPSKSSVLYICQHCLVHLGDISRYRCQSLQAETYYKHAVEVGPNSGQPYNQLAILEAASGDKLSTVFFYIRSLAVSHPFPAAATNLQKLFSKMAGDGETHEGKTRMSVYEFITAFLQFQAFVHLGMDFSRAEKLLHVLTAALPPLIIAEKLETWQLIEMMAVNMFAVENTWGFLEKDSNLLDKDKNRLDIIQELPENEQKFSALVLEMMSSMLHAFLLPVHAVVKAEEMQDYCSLPAVKVLLQWILQEPSVLKHESFMRKPQIWHSFCKLLNGLEVVILNGSVENRLQNVALPEDWDLQGFGPMLKTHQNLKFSKNSGTLTASEERFLRITKLQDIGMVLCEDDKGKITVVQNEEDKTCTFSALHQTETVSQEVIQELQEMNISNIPGTSTRSSPTNLDASRDFPNEAVKDSKAKIMTKHQPEASTQEVRFKLDEQESKPVDGHHAKPTMEKTEKKLGVVKGGQGIQKERRGGRQNVAMQTILQQRAFQNLDTQALQSSVERNPEESMPTVMISPTAKFGELVARQQIAGNNGQIMSQPFSFTDQHTRVMADVENKTGSAQELLFKHGGQNENTPVPQHSHNILPGEHALGGPPVGAALQAPLHHLIPPGHMSLGAQQGHPQTQKNQLSNPQQYLHQQSTERNPTVPVQTYMPNPGVMWNYYLQSNGIQQPPVLPSSNAPHVVLPNAGQQQANLVVMNPPGQVQQHHQENLHFPYFTSVGGTCGGLSRVETSGNSVSSNITRNQASQLPQAVVMPPSSLGMPTTDWPLNWNQQTNHEHSARLNPGHPLQGMNCAQSGNIQRGPPPNISHQTGHRFNPPGTRGNQVGSLADPGGNTYSLFSSPWPSGIHMSQSGKDGNYTGSNSANMESLMVQPQIQSLWSGPGPSPLERLLEQQKQWREGTGQ
ncbi:uncharacterized protein LOC143228739 [Tachypleus tridentatus]|uniref:uncharacterized protein LOC143228739 n=1 Tax=Tachypleus tridentatus TaxID=6853 RepID=UPI003FD2022D